MFSFKGRSDGPVAISFNGLRQSHFFVPINGKMI